MRYRTAFLEEGHSLFPQCEQHVLSLESVQDVPAGGFDLLDVGKPPSQGLLRFLPVGLEYGDVLVLKEVVELGIDPLIFRSYFRSKSLKKC